MVLCGGVDCNPLIVVALRICVCKSLQYIYQKEGISICKLKRKSGQYLFVERDFWTCAAHKKRIQFLTDSQKLIS